MRQYMNVAKWITDNPVLLSTYQELCYLRTLSVSNPGTKALIVKRIDNCQKFLQAHRPKEVQVSDNEIEVI